VAFFISGALKMPSVTVSDDQGQLTVQVDGGQAVPVQSAEEACAIVEQTFAGGEPTAAQADAQMMSGVQAVRGGSLG